MAQTPVNLLLEPLTEADIARLLTETRPAPCLPVLGDPVWRKAAAHPLAATWLQTVRDLAAGELEHPLPELTEDLYHHFYATGVRKHFEDVYFERRRMLGRAAVCALADPADGRFLPSAVAKAGQMFEEFSWALPAHVNSPSGKDPMHIDLFSAEIANTLAELAVALGAHWPADMLRRVRERVRRDFLENYVHRHEDFWWAKSTNHWNPVCHQGILGAALNLDSDPALLARALLLARRYLRVYLEGFGRDGECAEGPGYWQYGFGAFALLNEQLERRSGGRLSLFEGDPRIGEIARYGPRMCLSNFHFVNFSDSPASGALSGPLLLRLGRRLGDPLLLAHGRRSLQRNLNTKGSLHSQRADFTMLSRLLLSLADADEAAPEPVAANDVFLRDHGIVVAVGRDHAGHMWEFAAKAGHNAENHNHNDCGSYLLDIDGERFVVEIGAPAYTHDYFRENRYRYLAARTLGHSLPLVNGCEQAAGPQYAALVLTSELTAEYCEFSVDLTACYPSTAGCNDLSRSFYFDKQGGVLRVKEFFELERKEAYETAVIAALPSEVRDGVAVIAGQHLKLLVKPAPDTVVHRIEEQEYRAHDGKPAKIYRIVLKPENLQTQTSVGYQLELEP